jgi:hypothetical protein
MCKIEYAIDNEIAYLFRMLLWSFVSLHVCTCVFYVEKNNKVDAFRKTQKVLVFASKYMDTFLWRSLGRYLSKSYCFSNLFSTEKQ